MWKVSQNGRAYKNGGGLSKDMYNHHWQRDIQRWGRINPRTGEQFFLDKVYLLVCSKKNWQFFLDKGPCSKASHASFSSRKLAPVCVQQGKLVKEMRNRALRIKISKRQFFHLFWKSFTTENRLRRHLTVVLSLLLLNFSLSLGRFTLKCVEKFYFQDAYLLIHKSTQFCTVRDKPSLFLYLSGANDIVYGLFRLFV